MTHTQQSKRIARLQAAYDAAVLVERADTVRKMTNGYRYTGAEWAYTRRVREATLQARNALVAAQDALAAREAAYGNLGVAL